MRSRILQLQAKSGNSNAGLVVEVIMQKEIYIQPILFTL